MPALHGLAGPALPVLSFLQDSFIYYFFKLQFAIKGSTGSDLHGRQVQLFSIYPFLGISVFLIFQITMLYCEINIPGLTCPGIRSSFFSLFLIKDAYKISSNTLLWLGC